MITEKKAMKILSRSEMKNVIGGKNQSVCVVGGMMIVFDGTAGPAAIACGKLYGSACSYCLNSGA